MNPNRSKSQPRRRPLFRIEAEVLESRQLLTGGAGNTIALTTGTIAAPNGTANSPFVIESGHFIAPKGHLTLGVDVVADTNSTVSPKIASINQGGLHVAMTSVPGGPKASATTTASSPHAVLATINLRHKGTAFSASFSTKVAATAKTSGAFLLGYYLPGDASGDGKVDATDLATIKSLVGKTVNDSAYQFDADSNRDGKITMADYTIAKKNLGVSTTITPDFTANLDPNAQAVANSRITNQAAVTFTGSAAPGATIQYTEQSGKTGTATATADATGNYTITVPLLPGTNTFNASSADAFGQTITGTVQPVTYTAPPVATTTKTT
jgi:Dockerin type I domain